MVDDDETDDEVTFSDDVVVLEAPLLVVELLVSVGTELVLLNDTL